MHFIEKLTPKQKKIHEQKVFQFYILCANFKKIGEEIKRKLKICKMIPFIKMKW